MDRSGPDRNAERECNQPRGVEVPAIKKGSLTLAPSKPFGPPALEEGRKRGQNFSSAREPPVAASVGRTGTGSTGPFGLVVHRLDPA
jgi:hypothetical protein